MKLPGVKEFIIKNIVTPNINRKIKSYMSQKKDEIKLIVDNNDIKNKVNLYIRNWLKYNSNS